MKKARGFAIGLSLVLATGCAPSTFLISKDGNAAYFGRDRPFLRTLLCDRGELEAVLSGAALTVGQKNDFVRYICSDERAYEKVVSLYLFLTPEEKKSLKRAFEKHGYEINYIHC